MNSIPLVQILWKNSEGLVAPVSMLWPFITKFPRNVEERDKNRDTKLSYYGECCWDGLELEMWLTCHEGAVQNSYWMFQNALYIYGRTQRRGSHSLLLKKRIMGATIVKSLSHSKLSLVVHMSRPCEYILDENHRFKEGQFRRLHCWTMDWICSGVVQRLHKATHEALERVRGNVHEESDGDQLAENEADLYI